MNHGKNVGFNFFQVRCAHKSGDVINFIILARRNSSRLKWYKNYKNRLRLAKVIVKNKMSRFLWFTVYINKPVYWTVQLGSNLSNTFSTCYLALPEYCCEYSHRTFRAKVAQMTKSGKPSGAKVNHDTTKENCAECCMQDPPNVKSRKRVLSWIECNQCAYWYHMSYLNEPPKSKCAWMIRLC